MIRGVSLILPGPLGIQKQTRLRDRPRPVCSHGGSEALSQGQDSTGTWGRAERLEPLAAGAQVTVIPEILAPG